MTAAGLVMFAASMGFAGWLPANAARVFHAEPSPLAHERSRPAVSPSWR